VTLLADEGRGVVGNHFFRSPEFFSAEGVSHTLCLSTDAEVRIPLIVKPIPDTDLQDAKSPYGFPGASGSGVVDPASLDLAASGLVSAFVRHSLGTPPLRHSSERNLVHIADPGRPLHLNGSDRNQINKNVRLGYEITLVPGPSTSPRERAGFLRAYEQTMDRHQAQERYYLGGAYFDTVLKSELSWLALAIAPNGEVAAGSLVVLSDGFFHYYLSGTVATHYRNAPMKSIMAALWGLAQKTDTPINLGGGMTPGDSLDAFKLRFANRQMHFRTSELICDPSAYAKLGHGRPPTDYFPAYRA
jgi:hypothetical protein